MGIFDDILGEVDSVFDEPISEIEEFELVDAPKNGGISEVEKATNIWNAKDNGKAWKLKDSNPTQAWDSTPDPGRDEEDDDDFEDFDDDDDGYDGDEEEDFDDDEETVVLHHSVFNF
jgi:hypothetical protein